ncbi:MAG: DUF502 domain-containing protein [Flavobacterium sp.]
MKNPLKKTKAYLYQTFVNGIVFLIPVVAVVWLFSGAITGMYSLLCGLEDTAIARKIGGPFFVFILGSIILIFLVFVTGLLIHYTFLRKINGWLEKQLLDMIPGYNMLKSMMEEKLHIKEAAGIVVLVHWNESKQLGIQTEEHDNATCTVYFPHSSITGGGSVHIVDKGRVEPLKLSLSDLDNVFNQFGANLGKYLD